MTFGLGEHIDFFMGCSEDGVMLKAQGECLWYESLMVHGSLIQCMSICTAFVSYERGTITSCAAWISLEMIVLVRLLPFGVTGSDCRAAGTAS